MAAGWRARNCPLSDLPLLPKRAANAHKGTFGTVIVVGGSRTMLGAPALCASGALRAGCGLVRIAAPASILPFCLSIEPSATGIESPRLSRSFDANAVLAIGPGMGIGPAQRKAVARLLATPNVKVLDADGLNNFAAMKNPRRAGVLILTPHPGEFRRLAERLGVSSDPIDAVQRERATRELARAYRAIVVLKGRRTVISDGARTRVNQSGNVALAIPGSGNVLTGVIASLAAQGMEPFDAAVLGTYLHGRAGDLWARQRGSSGLTARDLAMLMPEAMQRQRTR